ncbi:MAG: hypothetical protein WCC64_21010 [Aliidongia sp.]
MAGNFELELLGDLPPGLMAQKARQLAVALGRAGLDVTPHETQPQPGQRGIVQELAKFAVKHLVGPISDKLLTGLKQFFVREQNVVVELTRPDGAKIRLEAKNVESEKVAAFIRLADDALG